MKEHCTRLAGDITGSFNMAIFTISLHPCTPHLFGFSTSTEGASFPSLLFTLLCMSVLPACMNVHEVMCLYLWRPGEGTRFPRTGFADNCEPPCGCGELKPGTLQQQQGSYLWATSPVPSPLSCLPSSQTHLPELSGVGTVASPPSPLAYQIPTEQLGSVD